MSEIKVGEYVRLKNGEIFKIDENTTNYYNSNKNYITNEIVKRSESIIDLIEVGDYVNGYKVAEVNNNLKKHEGVCNCIDTELWFINLETDEFNEIIFREPEIKSIVTHEQMEEMEYKL